MLGTLNKKILSVLVLGSALLLTFQNCSMVGTTHLALSSISKTCMGAAEQAFQQTYYPHLRSNCASCHDNGGIGIGWFASRDFAFAFNAFMNTGREKIDAMMVNDGHPGPNNGPAQQGFIDRHRGRWARVDASVAACAASSSLDTTAKNQQVTQVNAANGDPNRRPWKVLEWDLFSELLNSSMNGKIHLVVRIQYREAQSGDVDIGYEFRNPSARIRTGAPAGTQYSIDKITIYRNGVQLTTVTAFEAIENFVVGSTTDTLLIDAGASPGIVSSKDLAKDVFALRFAEIRDANGQPVTGLPGTGSGPGSTPLPTSITYAQLMTSGGQYGYFARSCVSCHSAASPQGGLNLQDFAAAKAAAKEIKLRTSNAANPMPRAGLLPQFERDVIALWADLGAP